MLKIEVLNL
jgi:hypothetical protein